MGLVANLLEPSRIVLTTNTLNQTPLLPKKMPLGNKLLPKRNLLLTVLLATGRELRVKNSQIENYKQELAGQSDISRRAITEMLKLKDEVLRIQSGNPAEEAPIEPRGEGAYAD